MNESSRNASPAETPRSGHSPCRLDWCTWTDCRGDHYAGVGGPQWPGVIATAYGADRAPQVAAAPTWGESDGLDPAVVLYVEGGSQRLEWTCDLRPAEALALAHELLRAAAAVGDADGPPKVEADESLCDVIEGLHKLDRGPGSTDAMRVIDQGSPMTQAAQDLLRAVDKAEADALAAHEDGVCNLSEWSCSHCEAAL